MRRVAIRDDVAVAGVEAGVNLHGNAVLDAQPHHLVHHEVLQRLALRKGEAVLGHASALRPGARYNLCENPLRISVRHVVVLQNAPVGQSALDGDHAFSLGFGKGHAEG